LQEENYESEINPYEKILNGTVKEKLNIAKKINKKRKIMDNIKEKAERMNMRQHEGSK
jgi:predicted DNA-binding protein YlxM (UPF0122 family)